MAEKEGSDPTALLHRQPFAIAGMLYMFLHVPTCTRVATVYHHCMHEMWKRKICRNVCMYVHVELCSEGVETEWGQTVIPIGVFYLSEKFF